ncbi:MAG: ATP-binding protein [Spirulina sp.]
MPKFRMRLSLLSFPRWQKGQHSLSLKLTLLITSLIVATVGGTTALSIQREQKNFRTELQQQANLMLDTLDITLRDALYQLDTDQLTDFMAALGQHQALLTSGYIYDAQGRLLADATTQQPRYGLEIDPVGQQLVESSTPIFELQPEELLAGRRIIVGRQSVGAVRIGLSTAPLQKKIIAVRNRGLGIAIIAAAIGAILAQWVSRSITKPIQELVQGTQRIARGNFDRPLQIRTGDELSVLATEFNEMSQQLQQSLALLAQQKDTLEIRVQQRTEELTQTLQELQETQAQLIQSEKMSSLGQLVAGIAHEINNPVSFIYGNLTYLDEHAGNILALIRLYQKHYQKPHAEIEEKMEEIDLPFLEKDLIKILKSMRIGTERIRAIILSLRIFSRLDESDLKIANLHDGMDSTLMILQHRLQANSTRPAIQVKKDYGDLPQIFCYAGQLNQVFMNLLANAIDALEESNEGRSYQEIEADPNVIQIQTRVSRGDRVTIAIQDNGSGIPDTLEAKLFNPFFTTKPVGKGTGLGLSISYRIITEKHGGKLYYDNKLERGTTFFIELPIREKLNPSTQSQERGEGVPG